MRHAADYTLVDTNISCCSLLIIFLIFLIYLSVSRAYLIIRNNISGQLYIYQLWNILRFERSWECHTLEINLIFIILDNDAGMSPKRESYFRSKAIIDRQRIALRAQPRHRHACAHQNNFPMLTRLISASLVHAGRNARQCFQVSFMAYRVCIIYNAA